MKERTRARAPLDWATTQNVLGNALRDLGGLDTRTARLEDAVEAYREALKVETLNVAGVVGMGHDAEQILAATHSGPLASLKLGRPVWKRRSPLITTP